MPDKNHATIVVRPAAPRDRDIIVEFNVRLADEAEGKKLDPHTVRRGVESGLTNPDRCLYFVAERNVHIVGQPMITYEWSDWRDGWFWWIQSVYVHSDHRREGVYRTLHEHIEREARRRGDVCGLRLYVDLQNRRAIETYECLGMTPGGYAIYETDWSNAVR